jgi:hypothetical protein
MGIIETLQAEIQSLKDRVTALEHKVYGDKIFRMTPERRAAARERLKARRQLTRDDIIEMAKRDVAELAKNGFAYNKYGDKRVVKFIVNKEKRTVVALLRGYLTGIIYERGIAKCHPDDCFNATIGRAIALRRALGLEVPEAYLNAPQPTEVRVGDIVKMRSDVYPFEDYVFTAKSNGKLDEKFAFYLTDLLRGGKVKIIDDSREDAEQEV